ncbi:MAG: CoA transferase, partial [Ilumatobacter sp.]|nr:CoA transferase [Ilumatobacter sp.]
FVWANRGKQSIELDLKDDDDRATLDRLIAGADVFIQNLSHAAAHRAGLAATQLVERHPHLVACDVTGYGSGGPRTDDKAYDLAIQAESGAMALTGSAEAVSKVGLSVADISAAMYALSSILAALYRRHVTGEGAAIELSMLECLAEWTAPHIYAAAATGSVPERAGHRHAVIAPYGLYELADGSSVLVAVQSNPEYASFATTVLGAPHLVDDDRFVDNADRVANVDDLETEIRRAFAATPADEIVRRLDTGRVAWARVRDPLEVWHHEQLDARDRTHVVLTPTGPATVFRPPFNISGLPEPRTELPALGEHDPALLDQLFRRADERERSGDGSA